MSKMLPLTGMIIAGLIGILFLADLAAGFPFRRVSVGLDIGFFWRVSFWRISVGRCLKKPANSPADMASGLNC